LAAITRCSSETPASACSPPLLQIAKANRTEAAIAALINNLRRETGDLRLGFRLWFSDNESGQDSNGGIWRSAD
jgi:hypothetical protein